MFGAASYRLYGKKADELSQTAAHLSRPRFFSRCFNVEAESAGVQARRSGENPIDSLGPRPSARSRGTGAADSGFLLPASGRWGSSSSLRRRRCLPPRAAAAASSQTVRFDFLRFLGKLAFEGNELRIEAWPIKSSPDSVTLRLLPFPSGSHPFPRPGFHSAPLLLLLKPRGTASGFPPASAPAVGSRAVSPR